MAADRDAMVRGLMGRSAPMTLQELVAANQQRNPLVGMMSPIPAQGAPQQAIAPSDQGGVSLQAEMAALLGRPGAMPQPVAAQRVPVAAPQVQPPPPATPAPTPAAPAASAAVSGVLKRAEDAYLSRTGGGRNQSVSLAHVRNGMSDMSRAHQDAAFAQILQGAHPKAFLMRHDDPKQISAADHAAAYNPKGEPFHAMWMS